MWSDLYEGEASRTQLIAQLHRLGRRRAIRLITTIESLHLRTGGLTKATQLDLTREFAQSVSPAKTALLDLVAKGRVLFGAEQLAIMAGLVVQHCVLEEPQPEEATEAFTKALLIVNELLRRRTTRNLR
jgi:hypothetical protein